MNRSASDIFRLEHEIITKCGISKERFRKVSENQWENIYQKIAEKYADKTKIWKNGLHWANINGYNPKSMKHFLGCYPVDYATWFYHLPQIIPKDTMVYFLIDRGGDWYTGEHFWLFESCLSELIKALVELSENPDPDFVAYSHLTQERFDHFQVEAFASFDDKASQRNEKLYMQVNYLFRYRETTEGVLYLKKTIHMMNEAGIPVTVENFKMDVEDPGDYIASVACEYDQIGYEAIKYISEVHPNAKVFFCAGQQGAGVYEKYQEGVDRAIEEFGDKVEIVATLHGDWLTDKAYNVTTDLIASGEEFDYIFANNGMMAQGCYQALQDAGMENIPIVSTGGSPDDYKMLQDGIEAANMTAPVSIQGVRTFQNLYDVVVDGKTPEQFISLPIIPVSADKLDEFIAWDDYEAAYAFVAGK